MIRRHRGWVAGLSAVLACGLLAACGTTTGVDERAESAPEIEHAHGSAIDAATLASADGKIAVIDGQTGSPATVGVTLPDDSTFALSEELPLVGVQAWEWNNHLVIAGTDCPKFDPSSAEGTAQEDCGTTDTSVVTFDLDEHGFEVLARHVAGERPPGPVVGNQLLLDGGRAELRLDTGDIASTSPYPSIAALPCPVGADLLGVSVDQGDLQQPDKPIEWTARAARRADPSDEWSTLDPTAIDELLDGASAAGIAGCSSSGPLLWRFADEQVTAFALGVAGDAIVATAFGKPTQSDAPPMASVDATGRWLALTPVRLTRDNTRDALLTDGSKWRTFEWDGGPLRAGKWAIDDDALVYLGQAAEGAWTFEEGPIQ